MGVGIVVVGEDFGAADFGSVLDVGADAGTEVVVADADEAFLKKNKGNLYVEKEYISKQLTEILFIDGIHLVTGIKSNMKNTLVELKNKILLRMHSTIETVNDELKTMCQIEHSRHRSFTNFQTNTLAAMIACSFFPKKPTIKFEV